MMSLEHDEANEKPEEKAQLGTEISDNSKKDQINELTEPGTIQLKVYHVKTDISDDKYVGIESICDLWKCLDEPEGETRLEAETEISDDEYVGIESIRDLWNENEVSEYIEDKFDVRYIDCSGSYNFVTKKAQLSFRSQDAKFKSNAWKLFYRDEQLSDSIICDINDTPFTGMKKLQIAIDKVDRHVFYKIFTLHYCYAYAKDTNTYNAEFEFKIPYFKNATWISFKQMDQHRPSQLIQHLVNCNFKIRATTPNIAQQMLLQINTYCRTPIAQRKYYKTLNMLKIAQSVEDLEAQGDLFKLMMKNVPIRSQDFYSYERMKLYSFEIPNNKAKVLEKVDLKHVSLCISLSNGAFNENTEVCEKISRIFTDQGLSRVLFKTKNFENESRTCESIIFEFNRFTTRSNLTALNSIDQSLLRYLSDFEDPPQNRNQGEEKLTIKEFDDGEFVWFDPRLEANMEQQTAIKNIVKCTAFPFPYVMFGPPGTGKTSALVECVLQISKLKPDNHILITAQSNSACDEIGTRLLSTISDSKILRIYSSSMKGQKRDILNKQLMSTSNIRDNSNEWPTKEEFHSFQIVIITLSYSSRLVQSNIDKRHFDYIFLDECAAASEPESLVAFLGFGAATNEATLRQRNNFYITTNLVLLGDHKQLDPVINSNFAQMMGLGVSLMERIMTKRRYKPNPEYDTKYVTKLMDNYRCHPAILQFSNTMFYDSTLRYKVSDEHRNFAENWNLLPKKDFPILFHCVKNPSKVMKRGTSSYNDGEIKKVQFYVDCLLKKGINGKKVEEQDIGIVSPYRAQLDKLRQILSCRIEIGTAEYYQGREKKIIIISTVKSKTGIGFLKNEKRLNVILTRAQSLLIVIGNPETLQQDSLWKTFIHFCYQNNAIVGEQFSMKSISSEDERAVAEMSAALKKLKVVEDVQEAEKEKEKEKEMIDEMKERLAKLKLLLSNP